ncbi:MAG: response regulator [Gammaproteobacteria bacterium]|nr:response regulator [Gammaproteobacteria bacterium]
MTISKNTRHIVLVEDEPALRENYRLALTKAGFEVSDFGTAEAALTLVKTTMPDVAIIDIGLGNDSEAGFGLCQSLRALSKKLPIVFLTARDSELDVISGLRLGADDYLTKEISLAQLVTRVHTLLRRVDALSSDEVPSVQTIGSLSLDSDRLHATWKEQTVDLTVTEYWLIACLATMPGQVKSRQQMMDAANLVLDDQTITAHIKRMRKKFLALDPEFNAIQTVYGLGYRWLDNEAVA